MRTQRNIYIFIISFGLGLRLYNGHTSCTLYNFKSYKGEGEWGVLQTETNTRATLTKANFVLWRRLALFFCGFRKNTKVELFEAKVQKNF